MKFDNFFCLIKPTADRNPTRNAPLSDDATLTLDQLAEAFGLTPRTARHYVEKVLPPHHRQGRGRRARYGPPTRNCFAFVQRARNEGLTIAQIAGLLRGLDQARIDRVAAGLDRLSIVTAAAGDAKGLSSSPRRAAAFADPPTGSAPGQALARWQVLYADDELQITHRGQASPEQRAQVRMAAAYIRRLFEQTRDGH